ncbi:MAG: hypothetical protein ACREHD_29050, partial [Pirellulales bacterium]
RQQFLRVKGLKFGGFLPGGGRKRYNQAFSPGEDEDVGLSPVDRRRIRRELVRRRWRLVAA